MTRGKSKEKSLENIVANSLDDLKNKQLKELVSKVVMKPYKQLRLWDGKSKPEMVPIWIFAKLPDKRGIGIAFSFHGHGASGFPWGLVFLNSKEFGTNNCWYKKLEDLLEDSGLFC